MVGIGKRTSTDQQTPLWQSIQDHLRVRIDRGDFRSGVPGELALAHQYEVSRGTIRAALAPLRREGLIAAHRGRDSTIVHVADEHRFGPVYSLFAAVEKAGMTQRSDVDAVWRGTNAAAAARLGLEPDDEVVFIRRTRFADDEVIAVDDTWLTAAIAGPVLHADLSHTALYQVLQDRCGVTLSAGRETLHAITTDKEQSKRLGCKPGTAAFFIERLGLADGKPIEWRETLIRGDRFTVTASYPAAAEASPA